MEGGAEEDWGRRGYQRGSQPAQKHKGRCRAELFSFPNSPSQMEHL